jgi:hypothetical protein
MARVYGRVQVQGTQMAYRGDIFFEPKQLGYISNNQLYANFAYRQTLTEDGSFDLDIFPAEYFVHLDESTMEVTVPAVNEVTLKELLKIRYSS